MITGRVHSIESFGTLDGPGLRTVVFLQGCSLNCKFCHNADCLPTNSGTTYTPNELFEILIKNKPYWKSDSNPSSEEGGITFSGGEPLLQTNFIKEICLIAKENSIHLTIDSCFFVPKKAITNLLNCIDYWMISFKHFNPDMHRALTGHDNALIHQNLLYLDSQLKTNILRLRYLVIPKLTDKEEDIRGLIHFASQLKHLDCIEVLAYGDHGKDKWLANIGYYPLEGTPNATINDVLKVVEKLKQVGFKTKH